MSQKDLVSDYFKAYPVLQYLIPAITIKGVNVSHRLFVMRQLLWMAVKIMNGETLGSKKDAELWDDVLKKAFPSKDDMKKAVEDGGFVFDESAQRCYPLGSSNLNSTPLVQGKQDLIDELAKGSPSQYKSGKTIELVDLLGKYQAGLIKTSSDIYFVLADGYDSIIGALEPFTNEKNKEEGTFSQNANGDMVYVKDGKEIKYGDLVSKLDLEGKFGIIVKTDDKKDTDNLTAMIVNCLGNDMSTIDACKLNFDKYAGPLNTDVFEVEKIPLEKRRVMAYRIIKGFGIPPKFNEGKYSFSGYTDDEIGKLINIVGKSDKISYIKRLMMIIGTYEIAPKANERPSMTSVSPPTYATIKGSFIGMPFPMMGRQFGGASDDEILKSSVIQYGGKQEISLVIRNIDAKISALEKMGKFLPESKKTEIKNKTLQLETLGNEIDIIDKLLADYLIVASHHPAGKISLTEKEVNDFKTKLDEDNAIAARKIGKFADLNMKLVITNN
jgi:hypothetical protein